MSQEGEQDRSELPTLFKLKKAREKGSVARGMDLGFLTGLAAFSGYAWFQGPAIAAMVAKTARETLVTAPQSSAGFDALLQLCGLVFGSVVRPLGFMAAAVFLTVLVFEMVQTGVVFTTQPLKPDFSRLNPATGLKRLFSVRLLIETGKNVLKLAAYCAVAVLVVRYALTEVSGAITDGRRLGEALWSVGFRLMVAVVATAVLFAILDQLISRRDFMKKMRMSRREVRRESRDREGDPRMKQRRRQLHGEFVKLSQSLKGVRGADVLITNPTHYAVALRYDRKTMLSPKIVSQGADRVAVRLKRLAFLYGVIVVENPPLARALHRLPLDSDVPEALFKPVADLYLAIREGQKRAAEAASNVS